jgi:hypothetical protein
MSSNKRPTLEEILGSGLGDFKKSWDETAADYESEPIPAGKYEAMVADGRFFKSRNDTPGYKITLEILGPEQFRGRKIFLDLWLTTAAVSIAKKELSKLGIRSLVQLQSPLPAGMVMTVSVALETTDKGREYNKVVSFNRSTGNDSDNRSPLALPDNPSSVVHYPVEGDDPPF